MSKTCGNCAIIRCYVINKALGLVGWCLLWQKSESGWDTVNSSQLCLNCVLFLKCVKRQVKLFCQSKNNCKIWPTSIPDKELKNPAYGRNRVSGPMQIEAPLQKKTYKHFLPKIFLKNWQGVPPAEGEIPYRCASIALWKVLACLEMFGVYNIYFPNYHISYRLFAFFSWNVQRNFN